MKSEIRVVRGEFDAYQVDKTAFASGGAGKLYTCAAEDLVYKEYKTPLTNPQTIAQLHRLRDIGRRVLVSEGQQPGSTPEASINWTLDIVTDAYGRVEGVILPRIPDRFFKPDGDPRGLEFLTLARANPPKAAIRVTVLLRLSEIFAWLHSQGLVHGDLTAKNVVWCAEDPSPAAYLIDCDELKPQSPAPRTGHSTPGWTDPRLSDGHIPAHDHYSDWYALALAIYRGLLLVPGDMSRRPDGSWPTPTHSRELDRRIGDLVDRSLSAALDASTRVTPKEWAAALLNTYIPNRSYDDAALTTLEAQAAKRRPKPGAHNHFVTLPPFAPGPAGTPAAPRPALAYVSPPGNMVMPAEHASPATTSSPAYVAPTQYGYRPSWNRKVLWSILWALLFCPVSLWLSWRGLMEIRQSGERGKGLAVAILIYSGLVMLSFVSHFS